MLPCARCAARLGSSGRVRAPSRLGLSRHVSRETQSSWTRRIDSIHAEASLPMSSGSCGGVESALSATLTRQAVRFASTPHSAAAFGRMADGVRQGYELVLGCRLSHLR